jgi:thioredoxin-related protein
MKILSILLLAFFLRTSPPVWIHDLDAAMQQARTEHKHILLNFSGSDWCGPCIRMHKEIFESEVFSRFASPNLVLVNADFPRNKKNQLPDPQRRLNDALAEKYNPRGIFPYTLLLDSEGNIIDKWEGFHQAGAEDFTAILKSDMVR